MVICAHTTVLLYRIFIIHGELKVHCICHFRASHETDARWYHLDDMVVVVSVMMSSHATFPLYDQESSAGDPHV